VRARRGFLNNNNNNNSNNNNNNNNNKAKCKPYARLYEPAMVKITVSNKQDGQPLLGEIWGFQ
jgi:hypothetical protein